jgi:predicted MFS family arabinose efflux permease
LKILLALHSVSGFFGNIYIAIFLSASIIADVTTVSSRTAEFAALEAGLAVGASAGPYLGGALQKLTHSYRLTFLVAATFAALALLVVIFCVGETTPADSARESINWTKEGHPLGFLCTLLKTKRQVPITLMLFLQWLASFGQDSLVNLVAKEDYGWGSYQVGLLYSAAFGLMALTTGVGVRLLAKYVTPAALVAVSAAFRVGGSTLLCFSDRSWHWMAAGLMMHYFGGWISPTCRSILSMSIGGSHQATTLGAAAALEVLAQASGPILFGEIFKTVGDSAALAFTPGIVLHTAVLVISVAVLPQIGFPLKYREIKAEIEGGRPSSAKEPLIHGARDEVR